MDLAARGEDLHIALTRYFQVPLDTFLYVNPEKFFDKARWGWHLRFSDPSFPERGDNVPEEQWDYGMEHAHLMEFGCHVPPIVLRYWWE